MFEIKQQIYEFSSPHGLDLHHDIPTITFRGAFGYALAQVIARDACVPGLENQVALYRRIFMPQKDESQESRNLDLARPFVMHGFYSRPDRRSFLLQILLFGCAANYSAFFERVVEVMSYMGLGKNNQICHFEKVNEASLEIADPEPSERLLVHFLAPCSRLKSQGQIWLEDIPFRALFARLLDRILELDNLYGTGDLKEKWDLHALKQQSVEILSTCLDGGVYAANRTSGRTGQTMKLDGFVGEMLYEGDFSPYREIIKYLPYVSLGRFSAFGCGWSRIKYI